MKVRTDCYTTAIVIPRPDYNTIGIEELRIDVGTCIRRIAIDEAIDRPEETISGGVNLGDFAAFICTLSHL